MTRRDRHTKSKIEDIQQDIIVKNDENYEATKSLIDMLATIIPYPQVLCFEIA